MIQKGREFPNPDLTFVLHVSLEGLIALKRSKVVSIAKT